MTKGKSVLDETQEETILESIILIRGHKVMLDKDLALLYGVETKQLKQAVKRNSERFPEDFMFKLSGSEFKILRSQIGTSSWGGSRYPPLAFTEQGVAMLSSVLRSKRAIAVNIQIIRVFTRLRQHLASQQAILKRLENLEIDSKDHNEKLILVFKILKELMPGQNNSPTKRIGYRRKNEEE